MVFGSAVIVLGIASTATSPKYWAGQSGSGIWFGLWILITGIIGFLSARKPFNTSLNGTNMAFNIVSTVVSMVIAIFYSIAIV